MRALVIDDDPAILDLVSQYLTLSARHDVHAVPSARAALEAINEAEAPFDCFLVDIQMPGVDGITLVQLIREIPEYLNTPIIMLTAMQDKHYLDRAFATGATDYVTKPFDFEDLQRRLEAARNLSDGKADLPRPRPAAGAVEAAAGPAGIPLDSPISLPELDAAIDYGEFENYVRQLLHRRLFRISTIAVKIAAVDRLHAELSAEEFRALIRDVAFAVQTTLLAVGGILTYRGDGVFLCVPERRLQGRRNAIQKALNKRYHMLHPPTERIAPKLLVGDQVPLGNGSGASVLSSLAIAIANVVDEDPAYGDFFEAPRRFLTRHGVGSGGGWKEDRASRQDLRDETSEAADNAPPHGLRGREKASF